MTTNYARGSAFERNIKDLWEEHGYSAIKSGGSKGAIDVIVGKNGDSYAFQCKPFRYSMKQGEEEKLIEAAHNLNAVPMWAYKRIIRHKLDIKYREAGREDLLCRIW